MSERGIAAAASRLQLSTVAILALPEELFGLLPASLLKLVPKTSLPRCDMGLDGPIEELLHEA
jgi:hypothetical protein